MEKKRKRKKQKEKEMAQLRRGEARAGWLTSFLLPKEKLISFTRQ